MTRIIYMGSPDVAVKPLDILLRDGSRFGHEVIAVVTQPARPAGRRQVLTDPPVALFAKERGIHILQPEQVKDAAFLDRIRALTPDIIVTAAFGQILSDEFLSIPRRATINIHPSLLPKYRGATPVQTALLRGENMTGVTILFTVKKLDAGPIIVQEKSDIGVDETADHLLMRLFLRGGELLWDSFKKLEQPGYRGTPQREEEATYARKIEKKDGAIDWSLSSVEIANRFRAFFPWPGSYTFLEGKKIILSSIASLRQLQISNGEPQNQVFSKCVGCVAWDKKASALRVRTGDGVVLITRLKPAAGKEMDAAAFWNGLRQKEQVIFKNEDPT